jgi:hypothetical protein
MPVTDLANTEGASPVFEGGRGNLSSRDGGAGPAALPSKPAHLVLQRKRADCGSTSPIVAAVCGQNANRQSEHEHGNDDDYVLGHHESLLGFLGPRSHS